MMKPICSEPRAASLSSAAMLLGLAIVAYFHAWWPGIMLAIGIALGLRLILLGKIFEMIVALFIFIGIFVTIHYHWSWDTAYPIIFIIAALSVLFHEFSKKKAKKTR